ncbi:MAG: carbohydrate ABC transporter permease [Promicromonosporaceae bacterium]|nr:carbohydrate ABC transporter permease [Promicromonosporaceae bacterium]
MATATLEPVRTARPRKPSRNEKAPLQWGNPAVYFVALLFVALMVSPVLYIVIGGFRSNSQISLSPAGWPHPWEFGSYASVLSDTAFWTAFKNSLIAGVATTVGVVALGLMVSFVLARYRFRGSGAMYALFASGLMFPMTVAITPLYILIRSVHLMNSLGGVILPQIAFALPTTVIILVPFLRAIPNEIQEAAEIDGCGRMGFFFRMVLPLSMPGVITVAILAFIGSWNSYMLPLYVLNDPASSTLPLTIKTLASGPYSADTAKILAGTSLAMLPALVFFSLFERRIVGGLTGAVKG